MKHPAPLSKSAREVIDTSQWFSIATSGPGGPHLAACWTRNILKLGYTDDEIVVPVWRMEQTGENLRRDSRIELLFVSPTIQRAKGEAQGLSVMGTAAVHREDPRAEQVIAALEWPVGALRVALERGPVTMLTATKVERCNHAVALMEIVAAGS